MDETKVGIDKISMSLDDIIKMDKKKFNKSKNNSKFLRNSYNKAKNTLINKRNIGSNFNKSRLGIADKRNLIKSNILINKRVNNDSKIKRTISNQIPAQSNYRDRFLNRNKSFFNNREPINITRRNDRQFTKRNNFLGRSIAINNNERPSFNNNERRYNGKTFRENNMTSFNKNTLIPYNRNIGRSFTQRSVPSFQNVRPLTRNVGSYNNNERSFTQRRSVPSFQNRPQGNSVGSFNQRNNTNAGFYTSNSRNSFNDIFNTMRSYPIQNEFRRPENSRRPFSQPSRYSHNNDYKNINRSQEREYEAMARALIVAHRDSNISGQSRGYGNRNVNVNRR